MHSSITPQLASLPVVADDLATLLARLGLDAVVRDPETVDILSATPGAESRVLAAQPGTVRVVTARVGGVALRVELLAAGHRAMPLTGRQAQVAACLAKGLRNAQIADELGISLHTVRRHLEQMFRRLGVNNRKDAVDALRAEAARG